jgi:hypothetical protein
VLVGGFTGYSKPTSYAGGTWPRHGEGFGGRI